MFTRNILCAVLFLLTIQTAFAQNADTEKPKTVTDDLRKEAVEFLRETSSEVSTLRSLENRISFSSEMAGLMWFHDEKQAAVMYQNVITDFKQLLADYDAQLNALGLTSGDAEYSGGLWSGREQDEKVTFFRKLQKAMGVRQQIAMSLAEHDATLAYNFYYDTINMITNAEFRKQVEQRDSYFELQLIKQIVEKDPAKALEFGRKSIAKGVNWAHIELLQKIYEKDPEKGAEFADTIVSKFKSDKISSENYYNVTSFLSTGAANAEKIKKEGGKKAMFTDQNLRDLAEILAQGVLENKQPKEFVSAGYAANNIELIEKYAPARAIQIRAKYPELNKQKTVPKPTPVSREYPLKAPQTKSDDLTPAQVEEEKTRKEQEETMKNVMKLGTKELPKEEREKIVVQARKIITGMGNRQEKLMALSLLASQVGKSGDKELAAEIMKDAATLVNPSPKNYKDYMETWLFASALSETDPDRTFPILEDAIFRLNDTISAFVKVGEFMDVSGEMIDDGEVQVGAMGGSMMNGLTRELGIATPAIRNLVIADFGRTKGLTNKFDRTEVRLLAKMLVLRAVLGDKSESKEPLTEVELTEN